MKRKMTNRYKAMLAALLLAMLLALTACGDKEEGEETAPVDQYVLEEEVVEKVLTADYQPVVTEGDRRVRYTYTLSAPGAHARIYHDKLVKELGFSVLDEEGYIIDKVPDYTVPEGSARYAKAAQEMGMKLEMTISWTESTCAIELTLLIGGVDAPPEEGMTAAEAIAYFCGLSPAELGLEGESMDRYNVYMTGGVAFIHGVPCMKLQVYDADNEEHTNHLMGTFFLNGDGRRIYRLNEDDTVSVVK